MKKIIYIEDNFISPSQCQEIINYTNESLGIMTAVGHSEDTIPTFEPQEDYYDFAEHHARQDEILDDANYQGHADFLNTKEETSEFYTKVVDKVTRVCKSFDDRANPDYVGVIRWSPGTFMKPHYDSSAKEGIYDLFAALLYLNDDFEGGETVFYPDVSIKPKKGSVLLFPPYWMFPHRGNPVIKGKKYIMSTYCLWSPDEQN